MRQKWERWEAEKKWKEHLAASTATDIAASYAAESLNPYPEMAGGEMDLQMP